MKNKNFIIFPILLFISLFYFSERKKNLTPTSKKNELLIQQQQDTTGHLSTKIRELPKLHGAELKALRESIPSISDVREEVRRHPHRTPNVLISFAEKLGPLFEKAREDKKLATHLLEELQVCVFSDSLASGARVLCLSYIKKLASIYPEFEEKFNDSYAGAPEEILKLFIKMNSFIKEKNSR